MGIYHIAKFFEQMKNNKVYCRLCPKNCIISDGKTGFCGVRKNIAGKLYSMVYGRPVAMHVDPIEKKPLYHFYPGSKIFSIGTFGCNLSCKFCQNYTISQAKEIDDFEVQNKKLDIIKPEDIIKLCKQYDSHLIAFTYTEPTIFYEYMYDIAKLCKKEKIKTVVVSNGQINEKPLKELIQFIDAFNIDIKAFSNKFYQEICSGSLDATKHTIESVVKAGKHLELTFLLIEGYNDDKNAFKNLCKYLAGLSKNIVLHISRSFPYYKLDFAPTSFLLLSEFKKIAKEYLRYVYVGNV